MPEKHFYFSLGALLGVIISYTIGKFRHILQKRNFLIRFLYKKHRHWFLFFPLIIFIFGMWGLIPDIIHALKIMPKEDTRSHLFNIFFFHSFFEIIEDTYPFIDRMLNWIGEIILVSISLGVMIYYIQQIKRATNNK